MQELNDVFACVEEALTADQRKKLLEKESEHLEFRACGAEFRVQGVCFNECSRGPLSSILDPACGTGLRRFERERFSFDLAALQSPIPVYCTCQIARSDYRATSFGFIRPLGHYRYRVLEFGVRLDPDVGFCSGADVFRDGYTIC